MATIINNTKRLFIACPIESSDVRLRLWETRERISNLLPNVDFRWEENPHVSVRFIGAVNFLLDQEVEVRIAKLRAELPNIAGRSLEFSVTADHLGDLPRRSVALGDRRQAGGVAVGIYVQARGPAGEGVFVPRRRLPAEASYHGGEIRP